MQIVADRNVHYIRIDVHGLCMHGMRTISRHGMQFLFFLLLLALLSSFNEQQIIVGAVAAAADAVVAVATVIPTTTAATNISDDGALCERVCIAGVQRICHFKFVLEHYQAMGVACGACAKGVTSDCFRPQCILGDGIEKGLMSINRQLPGPAIQVCKDDLIVVDVVNSAHGTAAAIHWHGLHMLATPHMDGVPYITQCPIPFATSFRYQFIASEAGTHFYHSHAGHHKINGQYGALIVREPAVDLPPEHQNVYDYDLAAQHILISDYMHAYGEQYFPGQPSSGGIYPQSLLINGRGAYINRTTLERQRVPPTVYVVAPGQRYRFRVINSVGHACPVQLQIEAHNLTVIASDAYNIRPRTFDTLVSNSGERYDFVLNANQVAGDYWIRVRGMGICDIHPTEALALLRYENVREENSESATPPPPAPPNFDNIYPTGEILNHPNSSCLLRESRVCVNRLIALEQDEDLRTASPDRKFYLSFNNYVVPNEQLFQEGHYPHFSNLQDNLTVVGAINNISLTFPDYPPLTQPENIDATQFCDELNRPKHCRGQQICPCIYKLHVELGDIVELIILDETERIGRMHHPFHLHGHRFAVIALGQHPLRLPMTRALAQSLERTRSLRRHVYNNTRPPFKDTVSIPSRGFAIVRFRAENPGFWLIHCHYEWHLAIGMGLVLQVGDVSEMRQPPKDFPRCGNYVPEVAWPIE